MRPTILVAFGAFAATAILAAAGRAQEVPEFPEPTPEHAMLEQFAGEWTSTATTVPAPGEEPLTCQGTEKARMMGGFWLLAETQGEMMGQPVGSFLSLGYDPKSKKYVGTFVCSSMDTLWEYTGSFDETGKKLILDTEGPSMTDPTKTAKYREVLETVDADHKTFTSAVEGPDGKWTTIVTVTYERVK